MSWRQAGAALCCCAGLVGNGLAAEYKLLPGGEFRSVLPADGVSAAARLRPFWMRTQPVSNAEYLAFVQAQPQWQRGAPAQVLAGADYLALWAGPLAFAPLQANAPVTQVSWHAAQAYCHSEQARLPRWYEWEFAAAADEQRGPRAGSAQRAARERIGGGHRPSLGREARRYGLPRAGLARGLPRPPRLGHYRSMSTPVSTNEAFDPPEVRRREQRGWYFYDWAASAFSTTVGTVFLGPYLTEIARGAEEAGEQITLLGIIPVTAESYVPYGVALSVVAQLILMPIVGAIADTAKSKKSDNNWPLPYCLPSGVENLELLSKWASSRR